MSSFHHIAEKCRLATVCYATESGRSFNSMAIGRKLARQLYRGMVELARERKLKVRSAYSYVVAMFERFPKDRDVLG